MTQIQNYKPTKGVACQPFLQHYLQELDYKEFKMFAMACIDRQMEIEERKKKQSERTGGEENREEGRGWCAIQ